MKPTLQSLSPSPHLAPLMRRSPQKSKSPLREGVVLDDVPIRPFQPSTMSSPEPPCSLSQLPHATSGFEGFNQVLGQTLFHRQQNHSLRTAFDEVSTHLKKMPARLEWEVVAKNCKLLEDYVADSDKEKRTAAAVTMLDWMCRLLELVSPALNNSVQWMVDEILTAIYETRPVPDDPAHLQRNAVFQPLRHDPFLLQEILDPYLKTRNLSAVAEGAVTSLHEAVELRHAAGKREHQRTKAANMFVAKSHRTYVRIFFRAWRALIKQRRADNAAQIQYQSLLALNQRANARVDQLQVRLAQQEKSSSSIIKLLQNDVDGGKTLLDVKTTQIVRLKKDLEDEKRTHFGFKDGPVRELQQKLDREMINNKRLCSTILQLRKDRSDSNFENTNRARLLHVLDKVEDEEFLMLWVNELIVKLPDGPANLLEDMFASKNLNAYLLALHAMSPGSFPYDKVQKAIASTTDGATKVDYLSWGIGVFGLTTQCTVNLSSLLGLPTGNSDNSNKDDHMLFLSQLFYRFAGCCVNVVPFIGPQEEDIETWAAFMPNVNVGTSASPSDADALEGDLAFKDSNAKWFNAGVNQQKKTTQTVVTMLKDKDAKVGPLTADEKKTVSGFSTLDFSRFDEEIWTEDDLDQIQQEAKKYFRRLRKIFDFYGKGKPTLQQDDFWRMSVDLKILDKTFDRKQISQVFKEVQTGGEGDTTMEPSEFLEALVRISHKKIKECVPSAQKFHFILEKYIFANEKKASLPSGFDEFKKIFYTPSVQEVVTDFKNQLKKIFTFYAASGFVGEGSQVEMEEKEFMKLCLDCKIQGDQTSLMVLSNLFQMENQQGNSSGLLYFEFVELISMVCIYRTPSPMQPLCQKLKLFIDLFLVAPLTKKLRL